MWLTLRSTNHKYFCIEWSCKYGVSDKTVKALWFRPGFEIKLLKKKNLFKNYRHWSGNHFWRTLVDSSLWMAIVMRGMWNTATGYRTDRRKIWFTAPIFFFNRPPAHPHPATRFHKRYFLPSNAVAFLPPSKVHPVWFFRWFQFVRRTRYRGMKRHTQTVWTTNAPCRCGESKAWHSPNGRNSFICSRHVSYAYVCTLCVCVCVSICASERASCLIQNYTQRRLM